MTSFGSWTSGGVSIGAPPRPASGAGLGLWPDAPPLARIHPRARRPHSASAALVQLAHAVLTARGGEVDPGMGILLGTAAGSALADVEFQRGLLDRGQPFGSPSLFVYTLSSAPLGEVSIALGLKGPACTVSAGSAGGLTALSLAAAHVAAGRMPACLAGGMECRGSGEDALSLFLLEPAIPGVRAGRLDSWGSGFDPDLPDVGASDALLKLARALSDTDPATVEARSTGFWSRITVSTSMR